MSSDRDLVSDLVGEIRAAVRKTTGGEPARPAAAAYTEQEENVRAALRRAEEHLTPSVPEGVRLLGAKRLALRALRFLWRDQTSFNALMVESAGALVQELSRQRVVLESARRELADRRRELRTDLDRWNEAWERRAAIQDGRLAILEAAPARASPSQAIASEPAALPPGVYSLFEERFRGSPEDVAQKQGFYLSLLKDLPGPVFDVGCGRGEFLRLLAARGIPASGVEFNPIAVSACRESGLQVEEGDGLATLASQPSASLGAVVAFQVVEHWTPPTTFAFLREARRALAPRGVLIAETINTDSLSALKTFFLDPSHVRPVPPEALRFLAEAAGFMQARIEYRAPLPETERLAESSENEIKLNRLLFGPQDYALVAYVANRPETENGKRKI